MFKNKFIFLLIVLFNLNFFCLRGPSLEKVLDKLNSEYLNNNRVIGKDEILIIEKKEFSLLKYLQKEKGKKLCLLNFLERLEKKG